MDTMGAMRIAAAGRTDGAPRRLARCVIWAIIAPLAGGGVSVAEQIATSVGDFSGVQGQDGWTYGYYDRSADPDHVYTAPEFVAFPAGYWTGVLWDWPNGNPPYTQIRAATAHPSGAPWPDEHWAIRRWTSAATGTVVACGQFAKFDDGGGNGATGRVIVDGEERFMATVAFDDTDGVTFELELEVQAGTTVDFAVDSLGTNGTRDTLFDSSRLTGVIFTTCRSDINGNGSVEFEDLLAVLGSWGPCDGCPADLDCDGAVTFTDVLAVIGTWGPCE